MNEQYDTFKRFTRLTICEALDFFIRYRFMLTMCIMY
jgi:hypothetical protein